MADPHDHSDAPDEHFSLYVKVFVFLAVCTALSFIFNALARGDVISVGASAGFILFIAVIKAAAVVWIFMHLKWDWRKVYFLITPLLILCFMMIMILLPDLVLAWKR